MAAVVTPEIRAPLTIDQTSPSSPAGDFEVSFIYQGLSDGEDILKHPDIPKKFSRLVLHETVFVAFRFRTEIIRDDTANGAGSGRVVVGYSVLGHTAIFDIKYVRWEATYKKVDQPFPAFVLNSQWGPNLGAGPGEPKEKEYFRWDPISESIPIEFCALQITVNRRANSDDERARILDDMELANAQVGCLHVIKKLGGTRWVYQPPSFRQAERYRVEITYTWLYDPGNPTLTIPSTVPIEQRNRILYPEMVRPGWFRYLVLGQRGLDGTKSKPYIDVTDMYPPRLPGGDGGANGPPNPYYQPDGYLGLPGAPF